MSEINKYWGIVPAAGVGKRMQADRPKQYLPLNNTTVIEQTLTRLLEVKSITAVVIRLHTFTNACSRYDTPVFIYFAHAYLIKFWILFDNLKKGLIFFD
jgi:2-C-methyl-D-erythritol 4-phosphate cytidylyltransferase